MCGLKCSIRVVAIALMIQSGHLISTGLRNGTAEILWNLSQLAVQGRQVGNPSQFQLHPEKFAQYTGPAKPRKPFFQNYPRPFPPYPRPSGLYRPESAYPPGFPVRVPALPPGYQRYPQSFMDALASVAQNDESRCIPKLLCELTSGRNQESILPFNIDMDSLVGLLSRINGAEASPLLHFGKAILLGYSGKGNAGSCRYAYPQCPQDPDRLIDYLNNHNGGFFRFFNGVPGFPQNPQRPLFLPQQHPPYPFQLPQIPQPDPYIQKYPNYSQQHLQQYPQQYPPHYFQRRQRYPENINQFENQVGAEKRIQNQPGQYVPDVRFPNHFFNDLSNEVAQQDSFAFPTQVSFNGEHNGRRPKAVAFPTGDDFRKPNTKPTMIFPDRTGTGELRLDEDELIYPKHDHSHLSQSHRGDYYRRLKENNIGPNFYYSDNEKPVLRFPLRDRDI